MAHIFVNLKRFEVPRKAGGLCPSDDPQEWISNVIQTTIDLELGKLAGLKLVFLLPEGLIASAGKVLKENPEQDAHTIQIGCQGVHWQDIEPGKNFGAFTSSLPAKAAAALGCDWSMIGHSEERRAKLQVIEAYDAGVHQNAISIEKAQEAINRLICAEVGCAFDAGLNVLLCVGETAAERGEGSFDEQKPRIHAVLKKQIQTCLQIDRAVLQKRKLVIGYEPVWAIGPGKTPPDAEYIEFVSSSIQKIVMDQIGFEPVVIYGGGLKEENAAMIAGIQTIRGGLVALTRFSGEIGFNVNDLKIIIERFLASGESGS